MTASPTRVEFTSTSGVTSVAWDFGGDGPPIVFSHATGFHSRVWDQIIAHLLNDFRCVSVDLRGHGDSVVPDGTDLAWSGMAHDLLAAIDALNLGSGLAAVGHSMGGASILLAEGIRPGTFAHAWLFEPITIPIERAIPPGESDLVQSARKRRQNFASFDAAYERYMGRPPFSMCDPKVIRDYVDHGFNQLEDGTVQLKCPGEVEATVFENSMSGVYEQLPNIETRVTVVGSGDGSLPAQLAEAAADQMPHGTYVFEKDLTHFGPFQDPAAMAASVQQSVTPPSS